MGFFRSTQGGRRPIAFPDTERKEWPACTEKARARKIPTLPTKTAVPYNYT